MKLVVKIVNQIFHISLPINSKMHLKKYNSNKSKIYKLLFLIFLFKKYFKMNPIRINYAKISINWNENDKEGLENFDA